MAKVELVALKAHKGAAVGERFTTSNKNSRALIAEGVAKLPAPARKTPARKAPAKKAATKRVYQTRDMKAKS